MIVWLMWAAVAAPLVQVDAEQLVVSGEGQWTAERAVKILHQGVTYRADRASYEPTTGEIILAGNVRSSTQGVRIRCQTLYVGSGKVRAEDAEVVVVTARGVFWLSSGRPLCYEGLDARFDDVDFSLCTCPDRPGASELSEVEVAGESKRVYFSVPVFRIREVPVLMLPWWSMPLKRRQRYFAASARLRCATVCVCGSRSSWRRRRGGTCPLSPDTSGSGTLERDGAQDAT